jgi:hypothetical protein
VRTVQRLALDAVTGEVVGAMRTRGIRVLLFKGPVLENWLYTDRARREYGDIDLMVAPEQFASAEGALADIGFLMTAASWRRFEFQEHEHEWTRGAVNVDLHRALWGFDADWPAAWAALTSGAETIEVGGVPVETPARPVQAAMVAVHAIQHGGHGQPLEDLRRALAIVDDSGWQEAAEFAERSGAAGPFALALGLLEPGRELLERMGLDGSADAAAHLRARGAVPGSVTLLRFAEAGSIAQRMSLLVAKLAPSTDFLRYKYPIAGRGRLGLLAARAWHPLWMCLHAPSAWRAWRRADAAARRS